MRGKYIDRTKRAGWDYLYEDCFEGINHIIDENIGGVKHDEKIVNEIFKKMFDALNKASEKMEQFKDDPSVNSWYSTFNKIVEFSKSANTVNKKVIAINMVDQFLRSTF